MGYGSVSVGTSATLILEANTERISAIITVVGDSGVFIAEDSSVTTSNGILVAGGGGSLVEDSGGTRMYMGDYYGATSGSTTSVVNYWERTRKT